MLTARQDLPSKKVEPVAWTKNAVQAVASALKNFWSGVSFMETLFAFEIVLTGLVETFCRKGFTSTWYVLVLATLLYIWATTHDEDKSE